MTKTPYLPLAAPGARNRKRGDSLERAYDADQPYHDGLHASRDDREMGPVEHGQSLVFNTLLAPPQQAQCDPGADVQRDHAPRFAHDAAKLALHADRLTEGADVG